MPQSKSDKQVKAAELQKARAGRTTQQQIAMLDEKFGKGVGAKKERARLAAQLEK